MVTHQLQVERRTGKVRQSETDVLPLCYATDPIDEENGLYGADFTSSVVNINLRIFEIKISKCRKKLFRIMKNIYGQTARYYTYSDWLLLKCYNFYTDLKHGSL